MSAAGTLSLPDTTWLSARPLADVLALLNGDGIETRVVGGAVRNALMGLPQGDVDLATTASPETVGERVRAGGMKAVPTGIAHGTVTVVAAGHPFEVTTLRHDVETHGRHATVAFGADWDADARRRDFTMNALYADPSGCVFDPVGGYADIVDRRVRFIGDAGERIREDYLRILRFFRFHAQYGHGTLDGDGLDACIAERAGLLGLSGERLQREMARLTVAPGAVPTLESMANAGILQMIIAGVPHVPSLARLAGIEAATGRPPDPTLRLAALAAWIEEDALRVASRLRLCNADRDRLIAVARRWRRIGRDTAESARREWLYRFGEPLFRDAALLAWARSGDGTDDARWRDLVGLPDRWTAPVFPLKGSDLVGLGLAPGPRVGELLAMLEAAWIAGGFEIDRDELLDRARVLAASGDRPA